jgi:hypothetical protein
LVDRENANKAGVPSSLEPAATRKLEDLVVSEFLLEAHFSREFKRLAGSTPLRFRRERALQ